MPCFIVFTASHTGYKSLILLLKAFSLCNACVSGGVVHCKIDFGAKVDFTYALLQSVMLKELCRFEKLLLGCSLCNVCVSEGHCTITIFWYSTLRIVSGRNDIKTAQEATVSLFCKEVKK